MNIQPTTSVSGTSFHGQIISFTYDEMVEKFGEPHYTSSIFDKTTAEWNFKFDDGTIFAIYDWKEYENMPALFPDRCVDWHIGSFQPLNQLQFDSLINRQSFAL